MNLYGLYRCCGISKPDALSIGPCVDAVNDSDTFDETMADARAQEACQSRISEWMPVGIIPLTLQGSQGVWRWDIARLGIFRTHGTCD
ncbi:hypothetical protein A6X21_00095 [Planctopirus hydrillae]|uniref:Uncharacterized protein n=1 Tax=Planctopirus hydrillae TaxID=1841610 RepID=A0A1C3EAQ2_9PLAN|nr:hypothetical protein A6X21_00095 [Planctopirus hydrillae]